MKDSSNKVDILDNRKAENVQQYPITVLLIPVVVGAMSPADRGEVLLCYIIGTIPYKPQPGG